jgi:hypothetical protein
MPAANLPERSYAYHPTSGETIMVKRGERGFYPVTTDVKPELLNKVRGVTPQQAAAMLTGSLFGWDCPLADPAEFTEGDAITMLATTKPEGAAS